MAKENKVKTKVISFNIENDFLDIIDKICDEAEKTLHQRLSRSAVINTALAVYFKTCQIINNKKNKSDNKEVQ